jgi:hypothetical protein
MAAQPAFTDISGSATNAQLPAAVSVTSVTTSSFLSVGATITSYRRIDHGWSRRCSDSRLRSDDSYDPGLRNQHLGFCSGWSLPRQLLLRCHHDFLSLKKFYTDPVICFADGTQDKT